MAEEDDGVAPCRLALALLFAAAGALGVHVVAWAEKDRARSLVPS